MSKDNNLELLCRMAHAESLQEICDLTYQIIGNPVFISDLAHTILSYTKCVEIHDHIWQENVVLAHLQRNSLRQNRQVGTVHLSSSGTQRPVLVEDDYLPFPRVIKTLTHKGRTVGVMVVTAYLCPFGDNILDMVDLISSFVVPQMMRERFLVSSDKQSVENFLINLLNGKGYSQEEVARRLELLNCKFPHLHLPALHLPQGRHEGEPGVHHALHHGRHPLPEHLPGISLQLRPDLPLWQRHPHGKLGGAGPPAEPAHGRGQPAGRRQPPHCADGPAGDLLSAGPERPGAEHMAATALHLHHYDTLSSFLIFHRINSDDLELFVHQKIQALFTYDQDHDTELCATLQVYLEQAKSLAKTAEILFIHRNTVRYRIRKCTELINSDLEDGNEIFAFILSLRILEYRKKILPRL